MKFGYFPFNFYGFGFDPIFQRIALEAKLTGFINK